MELKDAIISGLSHVQKDKYTAYSYVEASKVYFKEDISTVITKC